MKGYLTWHDAPFRKTHNLSDLGRRCAAQDPSLEALCRTADPLTIFAWVFRYPGEPESPMREEADHALALAREVHGALLDRLPGEIRPNTRD